MTRTILRRGGLLLPFAILAAPPAFARAQSVPPPPPADSASAPVTRDTAALDTAGAVDSVPAAARVSWVPVGAPAEEWLRIRQLLGREPTAGFLIRSASSRAPAEGRMFQLLLPYARAVHNSSIPKSPNSGLAWAGRGATYYVTGGVRAKLGPVTLVAAPEVAYTENRDFQRVPSPFLSGRSEYANPFHGPESPIDLPVRFGDGPRTEVSPGQSSASVAFGGLQAGVATENLWWGPGVRNALVMSNNAPGFPHAFLRTAPQGLHTRLGSVHAAWVAGGLAGSGFYDGSDGGRTLAAVAVAFTPRFDPGLTVGATRAVYRVADPSSAPLRALDVLLPVSQPEPADSSALPKRAGDTDQLLSLFGRWVFPASGFEAYAEWARQRGFGSLRELLASPEATQGYTLGVQWVTPGERSGRLRIAGEFTNLEQNDLVQGREQRSFYTSVNVPHGYTHRGRVIGAAIGPGSSAQWAAADYLREGWRAGVFASRTRWDDDALFRLPTRNPRAHDVQLVTGMRAAFRAGPWELAGEASSGRRVNWMFQNIARSFTSFTSVDLNFTTVVVSASAAVR